MGQCNSNLISYSYDSNGNINRIGYNIDNVSQSVFYLYNPNTGRFESTVYLIGSSTASKNYDYESDAFKRLSSIYFNYRELDYNQEFSYETPTTAQYGTTSTRINQVRYEIFYNDISKLDEIHKYKYDALHNIIEIEVSSSSTLLYRYNYTYDHLNQLIREDILVDDSSTSSKTIGYTYDSYGNIKNTKVYSFIIPSNPITGIPLTEKVFTYSTVWTDQITRIDYKVNGNYSYHQTYTYDSLGNPVTINDSRMSSYSQTLNWDGKELASISKYCESNYYKYNDQGIRTQKTTGTCSGSKTTKYTLSSNLVIMESWGTTNNQRIYYTYDVDGSLISF
jgi:hypothetical protein